MNNGTNYWLVDKSRNEHKNRFVNLSGAVTLGESTPFYGVRPCIYLASNVSVLPGGDGTINNPYRLIGDSSGNIGALLKTRIAGEYVRVNGMDFRIVSKSSDYTRLVATTTLNISDMQYHYYSNLYSDDTYISQYLNNTWASPISSLLETADFCRNPVRNDYELSSSCLPANTINLKIGVPRIGDMYTIPLNKEYWTINNADDNFLVTTVKPNSTIGTKDTTLTAAVTPVINIKGNVVIAGGNGTPSNPYTIQ